MCKSYKICQLYSLCYNKPNANRRFLEKIFLGLEINKKPNTMKVPTIRIKNNLNKEVEKFLNFLHRPQSPQFRNLIFRALPELEKSLKEQDKLSKNKEKIIIRDFVINFRREHNHKIQSIVKKSEKLLKTKIKKLLTALLSLMDYNWSKKDPNFIIIPTILPFSPFEGNVFYFSILSQINNKKGHNVLFVSVHEISHIILYKILEKQYKKPLYQIIDRELLDFLKEILAPVLMNQKPILNLLHQKNYSGNPFLQYIFVINKDKKILQVSKFFQEFYENLRYKNKMKFTQILKIMIFLVSSMKQEIKEKNKIWNKYGNSIINFKSTFKEYSKPIKILY